MIRLRDLLFGACLVALGAQASFAAPIDPVTACSNYRTAFVDRWEETTHPKPLNELAESLVSGTPLFFEFHADTFNRPWFPD